MYIEAAAGPEAEKRERIIDLTSVSMGADEATAAALLAEGEEKEEGMMLLTTTTHGGSRCIFGASSTCRAPAPSLFCDPVSRESARDSRGMTFGSRVVELVLDPALGLREGVPD